MNAPERPQKSFLRHIFGIGSIAQDRHRTAKNRSFMPVHQLVEELRVAATDSLDQFAVFVHLGCESVIERYWIQ